jgi:L-ascorbate metabolism protein UlaG (beta-lactamase superfamily)
VKLTFLGHEAFLAESGAGRVLFDPFLTGNPLAAARADQVQADAILLTHGHADHVGDAVAIAKRLRIPIVAVFELATVLGWRGVTTHAQHLGGAHTYPFGTVKFTAATHGSAIIDEAKQQVIACGPAAGILYSAEGRTVYHLGDTGLTSDLALVGRRCQVDVALVPIGDNYTMGPEDAAEAVRLIGCRKVVPCHYGTFPVIDQDPQAFAVLVGDAAQVCILRPGESLVV